MFLNLVLAVVAITAQPVDVYVTTADGEVVRGVVRLESLSMTTDFGSAIVDFEKIEQIHFGFPDVVLTTDGSELRGRVSLGSLQIETAAGTVTLWRAEMVMLAVMDSGVPRGMASFAGRWSTSLGPMDLVQTGLDVKGTYGWKGEYPIVGKVQGRRLVFGYSGSVSLGQGSFDLWDDGRTFGGEYVVSGSQLPRQWTGYRVDPRRARPEPGEVTHGQALSFLNYYLRVPAAFDGEQEFPALALFPGSQTSSRSYVDAIATRWPDLAEDYILVGFEGEKVDPASTPGNRLFRATYVNFSGHEVGPEWAFRQTPALIAESLVELQDFLPIDHWFIGGQSTGGFLTYAVLMFYPELVAGAFPISSDLLVQCDPDYFEDQEIRADQRRVPIAIIHGENDRTVPFSVGQGSLERFQDGGFPMLRFFTESNAGHMFSRLPVEEAVRWLEAMNGSDPEELMGFAERAYARGRHRDALAAAARVRALDEGGSLAPRLKALDVEIDAKARPVAKRLETVMTEGRDSSWVDEFWAFRADFGLAPAAQSCLSAYAVLRSSQDAPAEQLFSEIQSELDERLRRAKLRELVAKYPASKWYRLAKRLLEGVAPRPEPMGFGG